MIVEGVHIVPHALALTVEWRVQRNPIKKRRRNYRVVPVTRPGVFQIGRTFYVHPDLVQMLKEQGNA